MDRVVTSDLNLFGSSSNLVVPLGLDVGHVLTIVEFFASFFKVVFHHVNILVIVLFVSTWVFNHTDTK